MADRLTGLSIQPLLGGRGFNWVFLVEILVCGILALFFLFYFNRLFATLVAYLIRAWTWHKYKAYIDIQSLQISLLGGRVFFKSIRYHAHNITVLVHDGQITWRYWLRLVQEAEVFQDEKPEQGGKEGSESGSGSKSSKDREKNEKKSRKSRSHSVGNAEHAGAKPKKELPCRISVKVSGVEAFIYNRSPAYDIIVEQTLKHAKRPPSSDSDQSHAPGRSSSNDEKNSEAFGARAEKVATNDTFGTSPAAGAQDDKPEIPAFLRMFPIKIECKRAAAAVGNENTTSVVVAKVERGGGTIDAGHAGPLDPYKLLFNFDLEKINVALRPNRDFKEEQLKAAQRILREKEAGPPPAATIETKVIRKIRQRLITFLSFFKRKKSIAGSLRMQSEGDAVSTAFPDPLPGQEQWHGLARYLDDKEVDEHDEWRDVEYAKASTVADIDKLHLRFYFDMPGKVTNTIPDSETLHGSMYEDDMNGCKPPDYGMDFFVYGGVVTYGPWADRQRINLQQSFFPAPMVDSIPAKPLKPGEWRNWSLFKIFVSVEEDVILRIPSRESSKDKKWQGRAKGTTKEDDLRDDGKGRKHGRRRRHMGWRRNKKANAAADVRPYGWLDVTVKTDSTVNYLMDMFPHADGYHAKLDLDAKGTEISSSVNHGLLWRTGNVTLDGDLSQPISWNSLRNWPFNIIIHDLELFILRDHFFLIIDLVNDWSAGAPPSFYNFVPYAYQLRMLFQNFVIYLNVNDANIVNDPADFEKNDFLTLEGTLDSTLDISLEHFRPERNWIQFDVLTTDMRMRMLSPSRSTFSTLLKEKEVATLPKLTLKGSYSGHMEERPGLTDTLRFDIVGSGLTLKAYGFLVRQLVALKENYFGDYMHFKTLEEFQGADEDLAVANVKTASIPKPTSINELDVILCIIAEDVTVLAPTNLYACDEFIRIEVPVANLDLRILSYYLDMGLQISPISFLAGSSSSQAESAVDQESSTQLYIKHVDLDGHRAFGPPPDEPAYVSQWYIDIGAITGECSSAFIHDLAMAARAFVFSFPDRENALPLSAPSVFNEATFVQVKTDILRIWAHMGKDALLLSLDPVEVAVNDLAGDTFSQRISVLVPKLTVACVDARSASRHRTVEGKRTPIRTYAFFQTGVTVNVTERKLHFAEERRKQQEHIRVNDQRTKRFPFLLRRPESAPAPYNDPAGASQPPAMQYPFPPAPLQASGEEVTRPVSLKSVPSVVGDRQIRSKSSSSSFSNSIRTSGRPAAAVQPQNKRLSRVEAAEAGSSSQSARSSSRASSIESSLRQGGNVRSDKDRAKAGLPATTVAFSSPFAEPYFPLNTTEPDETNVPSFEGSARVDESKSETSSISEEIDDPDLDEDSGKVSVFIQLVPGIRAYVEPRLGITAAKMLQKILPKSPEEVFDVFTTDVLASVTSHQEQAHAKNSTLELKIGLPAGNIRILNPTIKDQADDQIQLRLRSIDAAVRISKRPEQGESGGRLAVHTIADSIDVLVGPYIAGELTAPAAHVTIDDILVYVAVSAAQSINASVRDTIIAVSGDHAEYLTDMILRVMPVALDLQSRFATALDRDKQRLRSLVYTLIQNSEDIGDPTFLSRITYILRAFPEHFRNQESWRTLARLRHILNNLSPKILDELRSKIKTGDEDCSPDVFARALESWAQERNWDVPNIHQAIVFQMLGEADQEKAIAEPSEKPTVVNVRSEYLRLAIEAGENANELIIEDTSFGMEREPPKAPTGLMLVEENMRTRTVVQTHTASIGLSINWSAFDMIEKILPLAEKIQKIAPPAQNSGRSTSQLMEDSFARQTLQIVASTDSGSLSIRTINLRHLSRLEGMRMSILGTTQAGGEYGPCASLIFNADAAITELHGPTRRIWETVLTSPSIYVDHAIPTADAEIPPSVVAAVAYRELRLTVDEQAPGLAHLADAVILDEVAKAMKLAESIKAVAAQAPKSEHCELQATPSKETEGSAPARKPMKAHFALLAGQLHFEIALLQELKYQLEGTAASVRVAPNLFEDKTWAIDFDVGENRHCFVNSSESKRLEQNILEVPPINGHVGLELRPEIVSVSVTTTMQRVEIDATAIQSMLGVLNRPEVQGVIEEIQAQGEQIKMHVEHIAPPPTTEKTAVIEKKPKTDVKSVAFDVRFAFLGVRVATTTPLLKGRSTAAVEFGIGPVHAVASNRENLKESKTLIPEVRAQIRDIGAKLELHEKGRVHPCGNVTFGLDLHFKSHLDKEGKLARQLKVESHGLEVNAYPETAATAVDVINHLQDRIKSIDVSKEVEYLRRLRERRKTSVIQRVSGKQVEEGEDAMAFSAVDLLSVTTTVQLTNIQVAWIVHQSYAISGEKKAADLVLSLDCIEFVTRGGREARLTFEDLQVQLAEKDAPLAKRPLNSAILPEVSFSAAYFKQDKKRSFAFKAAGKPLEVRLESKFMFPVNAAQRSIESAIEKFKAGTAAWESTPTASGAPRKNPLDVSRIGSVLIEADFAGTEIYMQGSGPQDPRLSIVAAASQQQQKHGAQHGRYGQFATEGAKTEATLKAPGFGMKVEYNSAQEAKQASVNGEVRIDASSNSVLPSVVPLLLEVSNSVKQVMQSQDSDDEKPPTPPAPAADRTSGPQRFFEDESIVKADPTAIFGKTKVDLGLRICRQEFALTCQPIAKVDAQANLDGLYITMNTVESEEHGHFFALSAAITKLDAQVKHMYSREPTFTFDMDSIVLSVLNSKHLSGASGISTILKLNPTRTFINGKQLQDLLLFQEIWVPPEIRKAQPAGPHAAPSKDAPDDYFAQRYQSVAAAAAFPWNATVQIAELAVDLDLGQSIGKSSFTINNLWASQAKSSNWEQNLCIGMEEMAMNSTGRMSGFIRLNKLGVRTTIKWPERKETEKKTPLIQASVGFQRLLAKAAFDYQAFAFGDIEGFDFLMYNVRETHEARDRLVAVLDCEKAYVFCTSTSPAQAVGLYQAFERLIQEKQTAFTQSLKDIEKHLRRESTVVPTKFGPKQSVAPALPLLPKKNKSSISLHTDVVVTMGAISFGVFPSTFFDSQILKLEANNIQARFAVGLEKGRIHSGLGMTLGQLQVALASVRRVTAVPKALDISVDDVVSSAVNSKGGIILRVPKVVASMETWQAPESKDVDFIFKSLFDGKIDVGWNLSRINFIKGMYTTHSRALASRLGKALPESAVKITAGPASEETKPSSSSSTATRSSISTSTTSGSHNQQDKITAEVNLPQSKFSYRPLEPPVIETPQLRDMGEATPPLEWIGLDREKLPEVTHQILIVSLLEVAREVGEAYGGILGSS